jgi:hypothetical protein
MFFAAQRTWRDLALRESGEANPPVLFKANFGEILAKAKRLLVDPHRRTLTNTIK